MTYNIKLPCGIDKNGNIVKIEDAVKGLACGCFCPGCKQPLVAKKAIIMLIILHIKVKALLVNMVISQLYIY